MEAEINQSKYSAAISRLAAIIYIVTAFQPMMASAGCTVSHIECEYSCVEYYPNGVDCKKTKKVCRTVCDDFDVIKSGDTPHRRFSIQEFQQKKEMTAMQTIKGILHRVSAIGGETTGWAIRLDSPLQLSAKMKVKEIELSADENLLSSLKDKQVEARGQIIWNQGVERGRYPVMMLESIRRQ